MSTILEPWSERIRYYRGLQGLSLRQLGIQVGVSFSTLARIERGEGQPDRHTAWLLYTWIDPCHQQRCHCARCEGSGTELPTALRLQALEARLTQVEQRLAGRGDDKRRGPDHL